MLLKAHFDAVERALRAMGDISGNAGHNLHIGTPREWLLRNFLNQHLPTIVEIGSGEVVSLDSTAGEKRNQFDLVIHRREHPRIDYGGGISGFLIEAVQATVEVKSVASYKAFKDASLAAKQVKELRRSIVNSVTFGRVHPAPVSYLIAYDGPSSLNTVYEWIVRLRTEEKFAFPELPREMAKRVDIRCPGLDAVVILGKGFLYFDNAPVGWLPPEKREENPKISWLWANQEEGNLLYFFLLLNTVISGFKYEQINLIEYMKGAGLPALAWGE